MMEYILGFGSPHKALKAEEILKKASVPFRLLPVPKALDASCGLVISVRDGEFHDAAGVLEKNGLRPRNVYRKEGEDYVKV
jgi:hypothetical protein